MIVLGRIGAVRSTGAATVQNIKTGINEEGLGRYARDFGA
jgi:hypothetical protein